MTPYELAQRYIGIKEIAGDKNHPLISWWLSLCGFSTDTPDEVAWCSAFVNGIAWEFRLPRSKSAAARSWLLVGTPVALEQAIVGDIAILSRGTNPAQGHVGFYAGRQHPDGFYVLGGNQNNGVCVEQFPISRLIGIRRLA